MMADVTLPDNATSGTVVAAISITMSDGSDFEGTLEASPPDTVDIVGRNLVTARPMTTADGGLHTWTVKATQDGEEAEGTLDVEIVPVPTTVTFDPPNVRLPDNATDGTFLSEVAVAMSDGSEFTGSLETSMPGTVRVNDVDELELLRDLTSADVGAYSLVVTTAD
jgi:hypothetical protein